jgi:hypothetical protein
MTGKRDGGNLGKRILISAVAIILFVGGAYLLEYGLKSRALSSGAMIKVNSDGKLSALMSIDLIRELRKEASGSKDRGPALSSVITAAGVTDFNRVEVRGIDDESLLRLNKADIGPNLVVWYTDHETIELRNLDDDGRVLLEDICQIDTYTGDR